MNMDYIHQIKSSLTDKEQEKTIEKHVKSVNIKVEKAEEYAKNMAIYPEYELVKDDFLAGWNACEEYYRSGK